MAENPWVPTLKRTYAEHDLWFPEPDEALTRAPTWLRRIGKAADGQAVTLAMVLEQEPASGHEDRIGEHRQALEAMIELSEAVWAPPRSAPRPGARWASTSWPSPGSSPRSCASASRGPQHRPPSAAGLPGIHRGGDAE